MSDKAKKILFKNQARQKIFKGIHFIADAIKTNLGKSCDDFDGDFVKELISNYIKDDFEKIGAEFALKTVYETKKTSHDGATTALIMLNAILKDGIELIGNQISPQDINKQLDLALTDLISELEKITYFIKDPKDITKIVDYYSCYNKTVSNSIVKCFEKTGLTGTIVVEKTDSTNTIEIIDGLEINQGYLSRYFCTSEENMTAELNFCNVLIVDRKISSTLEIFPLLKQMTRSKKGLLIIAKDIHEDVISTLAMNKLQGMINIAAVKSPFNQPKLIKDIAILTNAKIITKEDSLLDLSPTALGNSDKVIVYKDKTIIGLKKPHHNTSSHLKNKIAIIGISNSDENEQKQLYENCVTKAKNAIEQGVIAGGNVGLFFALQSLDKSNIGVKILETAIYTPMMQIISNAGHEPEPILDKICKMGYPNGFNLSSCKVENFFNCGILDPVKVVKSSLFHAVSNAKMILLTDALIINASS